MQSVLHAILNQKMVAILRNVDPSDVLNVVQALYEGGVNILEVTLNSPDALSVIKEINTEFNDKVFVGAGTVLDSESAHAAILAGASFIISPTVNLETIKMTKRYGAVSIPGAFTPTEILIAYENGADIIKVFPASLGPNYIKDIRGPLPQIPLLPTGGVNLENIKQFLEAGAVGCGIGSSLVDSKQEFNKENLMELTKLAKKFVKEIKMINH